MYRALAVSLVASLGVVISGCAQAKSANPLSPSVAGPIPGVDISAPQTLEPTPGAEIVQSGEPVHLLVQNPTSSGERPLWLSIELAGDTAFQQVLHQADRVTPGGNGRTTYTLPALLGAGHTYHWRVRAQDGANTGPWSATTSFRVVEPVVLEPPTPLEPVGNITTITPVFKIRNGRMSTSTNVVYRIEVGSAPDPGSIVAVLTATPDPSGITSIAVGNVPYAHDLLLARLCDRRRHDQYGSRTSCRSARRPRRAAVVGRAAAAVAVAGQERAGARRTQGLDSGCPCPATAPASSPTSRASFQTRSAIRVRSTAARGSSWIGSSIGSGPWTPGGATTASAATPATPRWTSSTTTTAASPTRARQTSTSSMSLCGHCGSNPGPAWIDQTEVDAQRRDDRTLDGTGKVLAQGFKARTVSKPNGDSGRMSQESPFVFSSRRAALRTVRASNPFVL